MATSTLLAITFSFLFLQIRADYAVLRATSSSQSKDFCVVYDPHWRDLPTKLSRTPAYEYQMVSGPILCGNKTSPDFYTNKAVFSEEVKVCSFFKRHQYAQQKNATELVIINSDDSLFEAVANSPEEYRNSTIPLAVMRRSDYHTIKELGNSVSVQLYVPPLAAVDSNLAVIWILAVGTVVVGAYWSGIVAGEQRQQLVEKKGSLNNSGTKMSGSKKEESSVQVSPLMVVIFVAMICGFLLLVYYLYKYVIYAIIAIFAIASCSGMYECLNSLVVKLPFCACRIPPNSIPVLKSEPFIKSLLVFLFSLGITIWWVIVRNASYGWILQDILGVLFCVSLLKNLRLPSMKICTLLLVLLLIYDVFFVFITPLFSASHNSVMVDVATGEGHKEQLPMVIKVPRILHSALLVCQHQRDYSLLGFGDILVPGLFVSFCHSYDQMAKTPYQIYYVASSIAYSCGLIITFGALYLMKEGQPALVYLVPCTLGTVFVISLIRREFCNLWNGTYFSSPVKRSDEILSDEDDCIYDRNDESSSNLTEDSENRKGERERLIN